MSTSDAHNFNSSENFNGSNRTTVLYKSYLISLIVSLSCKSIQQIFNQGSCCKKEWESRRFWSLEKAGRLRSQLKKEKAWRDSLIQKETKHAKSFWENSP